MVKAMNTSLDFVKTGIRQCKHCDQSLQSSIDSDFCCKGCETVYSILQNSGLSYYYEVKKTGVCFTAPTPVSNDSNADFSSWRNIDRQEVDLYIEGIHCSACLWLLEKLPLLIPDTLISSKLDLRKSILSLHLLPKNSDSRKSPLEIAAEQIQNWGYTPHLIENQREGQLFQTRENRKRLVDLGIAGAITGNVMLMSIPLYSGIEGPFRTLFEWLSFGLSIPSLFYSGRSFFKNVKNGIQTKTFPIDGPILLALVIAFFYSVFSLLVQTHQLYFDSLTALIFLLLSSRYYLFRMRQSSELSMGTLDFFKSTFEGKVGDLLHFSKAETLAFDGVLRSGDLWVDTSKFSGESMPIHLKPGDSFYAGTELISFSELNQVEVSKTGNDTRLSQLLKKIETCQTTRSKTEILSDRLAKRLLMVVLLIGGMSMIYFVTQGMLSQAVIRILALLIVTCPCALALATPLVFSLAMKALLNHGILIKDPNSLDNATHLKEICFDKTGTLTEGTLSVTTSLQELNPQIQSIIYSMTSRSRHPVSRAIFAEIERNGTEINSLSWKNFEEKPGVGLFASNENHSYRLTRSKQPLDDQTEVCLYQELNSMSYELARITLTDQLRKDTSDVIARLKKLGFQIKILSGDHEKAAKKIGTEAGIEAVLSHLSPEEKSVHVSNAIMVGDGLNDALALSNAKVSIAVQGGMDAAIQSSQAYSLKPGISGILPFLKVAHTVRSTLKINFMLSTSYNFIGAVLSITGFMNPLLAAILMPLSALSVFSFSLWRFRKI